MTHNLTYLPQTDMVVIVQNGTISAAGNYIDLMTSNQKLFDLSANALEVNLGEYTRIMDSYGNIHVQYVTNLHYVFRHILNIYNNFVQLSLFAVDENEVIEANGLSSPESAHEDITR